MRTLSRSRTVSVPRPRTSPEDAQAKPSAPAVQPARRAPEPQPPRVVLSPHH